MEMKPVDSSNIAAVGHDPATGTLAVAFRDGNLYHYDGVSSEAHAALMQAESIGKHFHAHIKGAHPFTKLPKG
jgi:hypothetical protein